MTAAPHIAIRWFAVLLAALAWLAAGDAALAQVLDDPLPRALTGVMKRVKETRTVRLGVRQAAVPFASINAAGQASGYSVDLCLAVVEDLARAVGVASLRVEYRTVTPADRIEQVVDGRIDLECGATSSTAERRTLVAFSPPIFIAGTQLLVKRGSPVRSLRDLQGRAVAVVRGTSNEVAMRALAADPARRLRVEVADSYDAAVAQLMRDDVAAVAADDILLAGYIAENRLHGRYAVVGERLTYDAYGIVFVRDDPALAALVLETFTRLAESGEIRSIYNRWFVRPLPSGVQLRWPMSVLLARSFEVLGLPPE